MADISKSTTHSMDTAVLKERLEELTAEMEKKFGIKASWEGNNCQLSGKALKSGKLWFSDSEVTIELTLGMMAKVFKGQIEKEIEKKVAKLLV